LKEKIASKCSIKNKALKSATQVKHHSSNAAGQKNI
jgi:hypothetical protein